jgi:hypothetical protein
VASRRANGQNRPTVLRVLPLVRRLLALAAVPLALDGCLVLSDPDFQGQDECLPSFVTNEADPLLWSTPRIPAQVGGPVEFRGSLPMRSCALVKTYAARVFVDGTLKLEQAVPPNGADTRNVAVVVGVDGLSRGCHQIHLYVSSRFAPAASDFKQPERSGDLAYVVWRFSNDASALAENCGEAP